jgi:hypothetical protein
MNGRNRGGEIREHGAGQALSTQRMELKYCERCGALGIQPARRAGLEQNSAKAACVACRESLQWLTEGVRR